MSQELIASTIANGCVATADDFVRHIGQRAGEYFSDLDAARAEVRLRWESRTMNSRLFEFRVADGRTQHDLIAKVPFVVRRAGQAQSHGQTQDACPRLFRRTDREVKGLHEFLALTTIHEHFSRLDNPQFGTIRMLDALGQPPSLIMEKSGDPSFDRACRRGSWVRRRHAAADLRAGFGNAGAWLRQFHELPPLPHTETRNHCRGDFVHAIETFTEFLSERTGNREFFRRIGREVVQAAGIALPEHVPLGLAHCDFAPRNVLLGRHGRVTVFDTQARWRAPVYEDLAHFLVALKASPTQICSQGWLPGAHVMAEYENEFLQGYFGERPIPLTTIRIFEIQQILEWWCVLLYHYQTASGLRRLAKRIRLLVWGRHLARYVRKGLDEVSTQG